MRPHIATQTMLLPSALPCDIFAPSSPSYPSTILSPPLTPTFPPQTTNNVRTTCLALQSLLASSTSSSLSPPPRAPRLHYPSSRRLLQSPIAITGAASPDHIASQEPRRKRRRSSACEPSHSGPSTPTSPPESLFPSTPKRRRVCPPSLPRGLERADFAALHQSPPPSPASRPVPPARKILKPITFRRKLVPPNSGTICGSTPPLPPCPRTPFVETIPSPGSPPSSTNNATNLDPLLVVLVLQNLRLRQCNGSATPTRRNNR